MSDLKYWLGFNLIKGIGPAKVQALLDYYGSLANAWQANEFELVKIGFDKRALNTFLKTRQEVDLDAALAQVQQANVSLMTWEMESYPSYLREIPNPPPLLYYQGDILEQDQWAVAVVGTRRLTAYGRQVTRDLVAGMVQNNITVVSGLARGIDAIAHKTAVELGGRTLAVLGSGLDCIYPAENRTLAQEIMQGQGAIISEYGLGAQPEAKNFPPRNRIISGLSLGVIIIEAGERSGALITTNFALEQNREVFAVPGNINSPASRGPNKLIQEGAKLVTNIEDVLEELNLHMVAERTAVQLVLPETAEEIALYGQLSGQPLHIDELSRATGLPSALVSSTLTLMELKGMVQQVGGMNYVLLRETGPIYNLTESEDHS
ncbi:MAG: DNA-protecting protein DprA [Ardenticatenaceae bacterium]|nr:DNA-processing protein DprA [Anaerolineales bacterium]MCB8937484.1 DNA-protecting protein DprA [Ardenticatenaceae bacterium]MCB8975535.1 DNA-protecting protein DprA [Ardenticatenaceae bacterium]